MGSTLRTRGSPLGRRDSEKVCAGNVMTARVMILCLLASAKACWWLLEQPRSSLMEFHPTFQRMLKLLEVRRLHFDMANFGGPSKKPTVLYSSVFVARFQKAFPKMTYTKACVCKISSFQKVKIYLNSTPYLGKHGGPILCLPIQNQVILKSMIF